MSFRDKLAQKIQERNVDSIDTEYTEQSETIDVFEKSPFFGVENIRNSTYCLDLRLKNGIYKALPYTYIVEINYDPSEGIHILTSTRKVNITGRNLVSLYNYLTAYRVKYIQANIGTDLTDQRALYVKEITIMDA